MAGWWFVLLGVPCAAGAKRLWRARAGEAPAERRRHVTAAELGLDRLPSRGALVQFSTPNAQSRISLNRLAEASAHRPDVTVVELPLRARLAVRLRVRSAPTVLHVAPTGDVLRRWSRPPERDELERELDAAARQAVAAASR
jgi:hypothetical protein